jgi:hypothetical protein
VGIGDRTLGVVLALNRYSEFHGRSPVALSSQCSQDRLIAQGSEGATDRSRFGKLEDWKAAIEDL